MHGRGSSAPSIDKGAVKPRPCSLDSYSSWNHSFTFLNRSAFPTTLTELMLIAAPAMMGLKSRPKNG